VVGCQDMHGVKPCLLSKGSTTRAQLKLLLRERKACFSKRRGDGNISVLANMYTANSENGDWHLFVVISVDLRIHFADVLKWLGLFVISLKLLLFLPALW
jgi:hypothetical protein